MENRNQIIRDSLEELEKDGEIIFVLPTDLNQVSLEEKSYYMMVEQIVFMDLYKQLYYQLRIQNITEESLLLLPWVEGIVYFSDIHEEFIKRPELFASAMDATYNFSEASALEKFAQVKSLSKKEKDDLVKLCPTFIEDLELYDREVTLEDYYKYASDIEKFYEKEKILYDKESIERQIVSFTQSLYFYDRENCCKNILQLSLHDYIWSNEWLKRYKELSSDNFKAITFAAIKRICFIQQSEMEGTITHALTDFTYLREILHTYLTIRGKQKSAEELERREKEILKDNEEIKQKVKSMKEGLKHDYFRKI